MAGPGPLLFKPAPRWQILAAFGGAIFVHLAMVALAYRQEPPPPEDEAPPPAVEAQLEQQQPEEMPTPPPEDIPLPPPPPDIPQVQEFQEEHTPPPVVNRQPAKAAPIKAPAQRGPATMTASMAKAVAVSAPRPEYPYEAKRSKITGSGVCVVSVDVASGGVTDASMASSTGNPILDNAAMSAFRRWRFQPGKAAPKVRIPITFTLTGASF